MKKCWMALAVLLLAACLAGSAGAESGELFFTVSKITLTLVGETEDIYAGSIPREEITWESDDEGVVTFQNGVLTATGVGETTVRAICGSQTLECTAGCLAQDEAALSALAESVRRSPKRYPPEVGTQDNVFFQDAAFIGDSITYIMYQYETPSGLLGHPLFLVRGGTSLNGFVRRYKNVYFQGAEVYLEDAVAASKVNKVFIMLGQNDLGYRTVDEVFESWDILLARFREKNPDLQVYMQSCIPEWSQTYSRNEKNDTIAEYNRRLKLYAEENDCYFVDIAPYAVDHINRMPSEYAMDYSIHMNQTGCEVWMKALNAYAKWVRIGGVEPENERSSPL